MSKKKDAAVLEETELANENQEDAIPLTSKHTITTTIKLISTSSRQLLKPFSICIGRLLEQEYTEIYVGDIELGTVFKLTDLSLGTACKGRLRSFCAFSDPILPTGLCYFKGELYIANGHGNQSGIFIVHGSTGRVKRHIVNDLLICPSGICLADTHLFVTCSNHTIVKIATADDAHQVSLYSGHANALVAMMVSFRPPECTLLTF